MSAEDDAVRRAVIDAYQVICLCNKIRKGVIEKAIRNGAATFDEVKRRTRAGTGPCEATRCGPVIRAMLGQKRWRGD